MSDWIEWNGGECPVDKSVLVDVMFRNREESHQNKTGGRAGGWTWIHEGGAYDIIAYRLHEPEQETKPLAQQLAHAVKKRDKHRAKLDKWAAEVERLKGELEREIEGATGMPCRIGDDSASGGQADPDLMKCKFNGGSLWDKVGVPSGSIMRVSDNGPATEWLHPNGDTTPVDTFHAVGSKKTEPVKGTVTWPIPEGVNPDDPTTWKAGDVVECVESNSRLFSVGGEYSIAENYSTWIEKNDLGGVCHATDSKFRFVRRPS